MTRISVCGSATLFSTKLIAAVSCLKHRATQEAD